MAWLLMAVTLLVSQPPHQFCSTAASQLESASEEAPRSDSIDWDQIYREESQKSREQGHQRRLRFLAWLLGGGGSIVGILAANSHFLAAPYLNGAQNGIPYKQAAHQELKKEGYDFRGQASKDFVRDLIQSGNVPTQLQVGPNVKATFTHSMPYYGNIHYFYNVNDPEISKMQVTVQYGSDRKVQQVILMFYVQTGYIGGDGIRWPTQVEYIFDAEGNLKTIN